MRRTFEVYVLRGCDLKKWVLLSASRTWFKYAAGMGILREKH